jgi:hypothetical protein
MSADLEVPWAIFCSRPYGTRRSMARTPGVWNLTRSFLPWLCQIYRAPTGNSPACRWSAKCFQQFNFGSRIDHIGTPDWHWLFWLLPLDNVNVSSGASRNAWPSRPESLLLDNHRQRRGITRLYMSRRSCHRDLRSAGAIGNKVGGSGRHTARNRHLRDLHLAHRRIAVRQ